MREILIAVLLTTPTCSVTLLATDAPTAELVAALAELRVIREQEERRRVIDAVGKWVQ